jgi:hypothetical protein
MPQRHVAIQPAPIPEDRETPESNSTKGEIKRRRLGVSVACNECRRRKIRVLDILHRVYDYPPVSDQSSLPV